MNFHRKKFSHSFLFDSMRLMISRVLAFFVSGLDLTPFAKSFQKYDYLRELYSVNRYDFVILFRCLFLGNIKSFQKRKCNFIIPGVKWNLSLDLSLDLSPFILLHYFYPLRTNKVLASLDDLKQRFPSCNSSKILP